MSQTVFIDCRSVRLFRLTKQQCIPLLVAFKSFGRRIWLSGPLIDADLKKSDTFLNFHKQTPFKINGACTTMLVYSRDTLTNMYVQYECLI